MKETEKMWLSCPQCGKKINKNKFNDSSYFPFCSRRCKLSDLEGWLGNRYKIPTFSNTENTRE